LQNRKKTGLCKKPGFLLPGMCGKLGLMKPVLLKELQVESALKLVLAAHRHEATNKKATRRRLF
jgi:hypothetical protein